MKINCLLISLITFALGSVDCVAQESTDDRFTAKTISVEETTKAMSKGEQPGFKIDIPQGNIDKIKDLWNKTAKDYKAKVENVGNEAIVRNAVIKSITQKPLTVYTLFIAYPKNVSWYTFFEMDAFLTKEKNEAEFQAAKLFVRDFAIKAYQKAVQMEIEGEEKKLDEIQKQLDQLVKENEKLNGSIDDANRTINTSKDKIKTSEMNLDLTQSKLKSQKEETAKQSSEELIKAAQKKEKEVQKEMDKLQKEKENLYKDIDKSNADIRDAERKIVDNQQSIEMKQKEVAGQKEVIAKLQQKLGNIR